MYFESMLNTCGIYLYVVVNVCVVNGFMCGSEFMSLNFVVYTYVALDLHPCDFVLCDNGIMSQSFVVHFSQVKRMSHIYPEIQRLLTPTDTNNITSSLPISP